MKIGESFDGGIVEVIGYNEETEEVKLSGGFSLKLKSSSNMVLPVPSGQPIKKLPSSNSKISSPKRQIIQPNNRVPPRITIPPKK